MRQALIVTSFICKRWMPKSECWELGRTGTNVSDVKNWYQIFHKSEQSVPNRRVVKKWYQILTYVKKCYHIESAHVWKNDIESAHVWKMVRKLSQVWRTGTYWYECIGSSFSRAVRNRYQFFTAWNLRFINASTKQTSWTDSTHEDPDTILTFQTQTVTHPVGLMLSYFSSHFLGLAILNFNIFGGNSEKWIFFGVWWNCGYLFGSAKIWTVLGGYFYTF